MLRAVLAILQAADLANPVGRLVDGMAWAKIISPAVSPILQGAHLGKMPKGAFRANGLV